VPLILAIGRLTWSKRFDVLLEALAMVRHQAPARLIILGEGKARSELEGRVERLGLADAVALPGNVPDVGAWLARADLLVSTSVYEGSPAVLIEALAAGVPVVATRCPGGSEELLEDGRGGSLVPVDDAAAAAEAILAELGRKRDPAGLQQSVSRYAVEASAAAYLAALDQAVGELRR
jgi:glycosyltransferase involved in cell wall biosynthesis